MRDPSRAGQWQTGPIVSLNSPSAQHSPGDLLAGLDPEQRAVAELTNGPVLVIAGAGTGKTTAITYRIANAVRTGAHDPARSIALTFTNRAAGEMTRRLATLGVPEVRVRTFHSAALRQLRWAWPMAVGGSMPELMTSKIGLLSAVMSSRGLGGDSALVRELASEIEWCKAVQVTPDGYDQARVRVGRLAPAKIDSATFADIYQGYEQAKRDGGRLDFEDVLLLTVGILEERADLRRTVQQSFAHFSVDEFQDVSDIQERLLACWLGDRDDICVVGDPRQTIYSFAGANLRHIEQFKLRHAAANVVSLVRCYRCSPEIVAVATKTIAAGSTRPVPPSHHLVSQAESGPTPRLDRFDDETAEAGAVAATIVGLSANGVPLKEIAILVRVNAATEPFEAALAAAGVPYTIRGGKRFFQRPEVKRACALLRAAARTGESGPLNSTVRGLLADVGWSPQPPTGTGAVREAWESLAALLALVDELLAVDPDAGLTELVAEIDRRAEAQDAPAGDGVTLASLHAAKGLEWDTVFLPSLVDGVIPLTHASTTAELEEERRLLYVGMTRARRDLRLSWARSRSVGGRQRRLSRFVPMELAGERDSSPAAARSKTRLTSRRAPAKCRGCGKALVTGPERAVGRCRTCPAAIDLALLEDLRKWRSEQVASQTGQSGKAVPAFLVATDATLASLAELRPTTAAELAEVPGLGPVKTQRYGNDLLRMINRTEKSMDGSA